MYDLSTIDLLARSGRYHQGMCLLGLMTTTLEFETLSLEW